MALKLSLLWLTYSMPLEAIARPCLTPKDRVVGKTAWTKKAGVMIGLLCMIHLHKDDVGRCPE